MPKNFKLARSIQHLFSPKLQISLRMTKPTKWYGHRTKSQIRLGWSKHMPRLIWVFAGRTASLLVFCRAAAQIKRFYNVKIYRPNHGLSPMSILILLFMMQPPPPPPHTHTHRQRDSYVNFSSLANFLCKCSKRVKNSATDISKTKTNKQ